MGPQTKLVATEVSLKLGSESLGGGARLRIELLVRPVRVCLHS